MSAKIEVIVPVPPADNSGRLQTWKESRKDLFLVGSSPPDARSTLRAEEQPAQTRYSRQGRRDVFMMLHCSVL